MTAKDVFLDYSKALVAMFVISVLDDSRMRDPCVVSNSERHYELEGVRCRPNMKDVRLCASKNGEGHDESSAAVVLYWHDCMISRLTLFSLTC